MVRSARFLAPLLPVLVALVAGCSQTSGAKVETATPPARGVVIAKIVTHDSRVEILSSPAGQADLRVVVRRLDGTMVADGITVEALRARDPELYTVVTSAFASNGQGYVDATLDLGHLN